MKAGLILFAALGIVASIELAACAVSTQSPAALKATPTQGNPQIVFSITSSTAIIDIMSPTGIGGAAIEKTGGQWPLKVAMRFHLKGLEDLKFTYGARTMAVSVSSTGDNAVRESAIIGDSETPIKNDSPYWMAVNIVSKDGSPGKIPLEDGTIEVTAPADFLQGDNAQFSIEWIDFYR